MAQKNFIEERRNKVLDYINQNSRADIAELAQLLDCTEATIRRDLDYLEQKDLLIRTHGGAIRKEKSRSVWQTTPVSERLEQNVKTDLQKALQRLPERERVLMVLYYQENMTMKEIGETLGMSESRVCQLHAQAIMKLKNILNENRTSRLQKAIV